MQRKHKLALFQINLHNIVLENVVIERSSHIDSLGMHMVDTPPKRRCGLTLFYRYALLITLLPKFMIPNLENSTYNSPASKNAHPHPFSFQ